MNKTSIEWTHRPETGGEAGGFTWNPIRAKAAVPNGHRAGTFCTRISPGCLHCYASTINKRFGNGLEFTVPNLEKVEFFIDEKILAEPLRRKKPATIFVGDMFDLFHEAIPQELIAMVFGVIASAGWHTFQVLTKRATRMQALIADVSEESFGCSVNEEWYVNRLNGVDGLWNWPLPNLWLGVSVESQQYADERIPLLLQTPAAVRFLSVEPMLEAVDLENLPSASGIGRHLNCLNNSGVDSGVEIASKIDWVICGGESGPGARPFNLAWAEYLQEQCKVAGVAFFMKQMGSFPFNGSKIVGRDRINGATLHQRIRLKDSKGGDMSEWPEHLRVREFPQ